MTDIKQFFLSKLSELVACDEQQPVLGSLDFSATYDRLNEAIDPSRLLLPDSRTETFSGNNGILISFQTTNLLPVFTKRINDTPFYLSYLGDDDKIVYILDFYEWLPRTVIYRLILVEFLNKNIPFICQFPDFVKTSRDANLKSGGYHIAWHTSAPTSYADKELKIFPSDQLSSFDLIITISAQRAAPAGISPDSAMKTYFKLEHQARAGFISRFIRTQKKTFDTLLNTAWARIKGITPDLQVDPALLDDKGKHSITARWTLEICRILGLEQCYAELAKQVNRNPEKSMGSNGYPQFYQDIFHAYYTEELSTDKTIAILQAWWDRYSRPVFEIKLRQMVEHQLEYLFMIYSLAQRCRLLWCEKLLVQCRYFEDIPELNLLARIQGLLIFKSGEGRSRRIYRGIFSAGNLIEFRQGFSTYRYSSFGKKLYSEIKQKKRQIFKIDKEVDFEIDDIKNELAIVPSVIPLHEEVFKENRLVLEVDEQILQLPLVWSQGTLSFHEFRLSWLLKKERFQLTCKAGKSVNSIKINGEPFQTGPGGRLKTYLPVKKSSIQMGLLLTDSLGRSSLLASRSMPQKIFLSGWIQDRYKIFAQHFNIPRGTRQMICRVAESGMVQCSVEVKSMDRQLNLTYKKHCQSLELNWITDQSLAAFLSYSPEGDKGFLLVMISENLQDGIHWIRERLKESLGFIPVISVVSKLKIPPPAYPLLLLIRKGEEDFNIGNNLKPLTLEIDEKVSDFFSVFFPLSKKPVKIEKD
jgi:hypothetical protein